MFLQKFYKHNCYSFLYKLYNSDVEMLRFQLCRYTRNSCRYLSSLPKSLEIKKAQESSDPVIKKYKQLLHNIQMSQSPEIIYATNFGSVRFDSELPNTKKLHKHFMANKTEEINSNSKNLKQDHPSESDQSMNYIDEVYFSSSATCINDSVGSLENETKPSSIKSLNDLNYVDQQYISTGINGNQNVPNASNKNISVNSLQETDLNYIDSQIFTSHQSNKLDNKSDYISENAGLSESHVLNEEKNELDFLYNFEDSIMENTQDSMVIRSKCQSEIQDTDMEIRRKYLEEELLSLTPEGSNYVENLKSTTKVKTQQFGALSDTKKDSNPNEPLNSDVTPSPSSVNLSKFTIKSRSAYSFVLEKRKEELKSSKKEVVGEILPHELFKKIILAVPTYSQHTQYDMAQELKQHILYNENDIVAISKPYGIPVHGGGGDNKVHKRLNIVNILPLLKELIKEETLEPVHRLDLNTTGVLLLAKTAEMAEKLKKMFKEHKIKKTYLAITKGTPNPMNGLIDIPIGEGFVDRYKRMVLLPDVTGFRGKSGQSKKAITRYKVLSVANGTSLLEVTPITGVKHQIRVHLGFGINCPVFADHKYSFLTKIAPQKLPGDTLEKLGLKQSAVRALPLCLHSFGVRIPIYDENGRDIFIKTGPPKFFKKTLTALKLSSRKNRLDDEYSDIIYGYE